MNILILSDIFPEPYHPQHAIFVAEQAKELSKMVNVTVIAPVVKSLPIKEIYMKERREKAFIPQSYMIEMAKVFRPRFLGLFWHLDSLNVYFMLSSILRLIRKENIKIDLIHSHFAYSTGYVGVLLGKLLKKPVLLTVHGYDFDIYTKSEDSILYGPQRLYSPIIHKMVLYALNKSLRIVTVCNRMKEKLLAIGINKTKVVVIRNGVDTERFKPLGQKNARTLIGEAINDKMILFIGGLTYRKNVITLIEATYKLITMGQKVRLSIIGEGPLKKELQGEVERRGMRLCTRFIDPIPAEDVPLWMNACDVFVLPSLYESFGCVLLEAIACGRPIVANRVGGILDFIKEEHGILVEPDNPVALAEAIIDALNRPWDLQKIVSYARENSWRNVARRLYQEYGKIIQEYSKVKEEDMDEI